MLDFVNKCGWNSQHTGICFKNPHQWAYAHLPRMIVGMYGAGCVVEAGMLGGCAGLPAAGLCWLPGVLPPVHHHLPPVPATKSKN